MPESHVNPQQKAVVKQRAQDCCEYCWSQEAYSPDTFSVEHITPQAKGGRNDLDNLANACQGCNNHKYISTEAVDPLSGEIVPLYHPRRDEWSAHFAWNYDYTLILGISPTGRATVERLELNRKGVVNLRYILHALDLHPIETLL